MKRKQGPVPEPGVHYRLLGGYVQQLDYNVLELKCCGYHAKEPGGILPHWALAGEFSKHIRNDPTRWGQACQSCTAEKRRRKNKG